MSDIAYDPAVHCPDCLGSGRCFGCDDVYPANESCPDCGTYAGVCRACSGAGKRYVEQVAERRIKELNFESWH